jgi:hypothetical protein
MQKKPEEKSCYLRFMKEVGLPEEEIADLEKQGLRAIIKHAKYAGAAFKSHHLVKCCHPDGRVRGCMPGYFPPTPEVQQRGNFIYDRAVLVEIGKFSKDLLVGRKAGLYCCKACVNRGRKICKDDYRTKDPTLDNIFCSTEMTVAYDCPNCGVVKSKAACLGKGEVDIYFCWICGECLGRLEINE